jgi:hypothetical protein
MTSAGEQLAVRVCVQTRGSLQQLHTLQLHTLQQCFCPGTRPCALLLAQVPASAPNSAPDQPRTSAIRVLPAHPARQAVSHGMSVLALSLP